MEKKEAMKILKDFYDKSALFSIRTALDTVIPELKESEEEKTKRILHSISSKMSFHLRNIFTEEEFQCFDAWSNAWLEKQGEQKPIESMSEFKEGDILYNKDSYTSDSIFIFKGMSDKTNAYLCYARLYDEKDFSVYSKEDWDKGVGVCGGEFYPANHKQKELLFSKMEESGYRWNPDEKKMEKIEQNDTDKVEQKGMNIVEEDMTPFQKKVFCIIDTAKEEEQGLKQVCDELLRLAHDEILLEPAWSEEDENKVTLFMQLTEGCDNEEELADWLKSLKDRIQPKQEWSEEDRRMLVGLIDELDAIMNKATSNEISVYSKYTNWLKSLRPQNTWKPSGFYLECISDAIVMYETRGINAIGLKEILEELKKLKG